jgi:hypothetical protein
VSCSKISSFPPSRTSSFITYNLAFLASAITGRVRQAGNSTVETRLEGAGCIGSGATDATCTPFSCFTFGVQQFCATRIREGIRLDFFVLMRCSVVGGYQRFGGTYHFHVQSG